MKLLASIVFTAALFGLSPMARADDPSLHEVYQAIHSGHLSEAQSMMTKVLHDHPESAKAHYMEAEVLVRMDRADEAQIELDHADRLAPGLPFATAEAQRSLRGLIAEHSHVRAGGDRSLERASAFSDPRPAGPSIPWGPILIIGGVGLLLFLFLRARRQAMVPVGGPGMAPGMAPMGSPYGSPYGGAPMGGGIGSSIVGGLATGAAIGAGMVAGEALAHEFTGNHERSGDLSGGDPQRYASADDGGGRDFGVSDADSWDSGSGDIGDSGGGGGDWG